MKIKLGKEEFKPNTKPASTQTNHSDIERLEELKQPWDKSHQSGIIELLPYCGRKTVCLKIGTFCDDMLASHG